MSTELRSLPEGDQLRLVAHLHSEGMFGVYENPEDFITLKNKRVSPHYLDIRSGISSAETRNKIASSMLKLAGDDFDHIAGIPEAFTVYATTMADISRKSLLQPRVAQKERGNKTPILGTFEDGDEIAVFDDVVTDGQTKIDAIRSLGAAGIKVTGFFVLMDRQEGGAAQVLEATGLEIASALRVSSVVRMLRAEGAISKTQYDNVREYLERYGDTGALESIDDTELS